MENQKNSSPQILREIGESKNVNFSNFELKGIFAIFPTSNLLKSKSVLTRVTKQ